MPLIRVSDVDIESIHDVKFKAVIKREQDKMKKKPEKPEKPSEKSK